MSADLTLLKEYMDGLRLDRNNLTADDLAALENELKDAGEYGLARLVAGLTTPQELLDYVGSEEE